MQLMRLLNQVHASLHAPGFLKLLLSANVCMCVSEYVHLDTK